MKQNKKPKPITGKNYKNNNNINNYLIFKNVPKILQQMNEYSRKPIQSYKIVRVYKESMRVLSHDLLPHPNSA